MIVTRPRQRECFQVAVRNNTMKQSMGMSAPQMKFAGCNVTIYQGTASAPTQSSGVAGLLDGIDIDAIFAD